MKINHHYLIGGGSNGQIDTNIYVFYYISIYIIDYWFSNWIIHLNE